MRLMLSCLAVLAFAVPEWARADDERPERSGAWLAQAERQAPPAPGRAGVPAAAPPTAAPPPAPMRAAPPPATPQPGAPAPGRVAPAPPPGTPPGARHPTAPAPPPGAPARPPGYYYGPGYYPYYPYYVSPWAYSAYLAAPWWWGWGWGYGWYPVYPEPPLPPPGEAPPARRINAEFAFTGGPTDQRAFDDPTRRLGPGASAGFSLRVESQELGVHAGYDGFFTDGQVNFGSATALDYFTAHLTWSFLSGQSGRLRLETGVSVLTWPTLPPFGSVTAVGPEAGLSGQVSLLGPFGVIGYARVTPWPRMATDLHAAAALRFGPMAVTGGWRDLRADGGDGAPDLRFAGPQFGLALLF